LSGEEWRGRICTGAGGWGAVWGKSGEDGR
jgi:hypothetical protein